MTSLLLFVIFVVVVVQLHNRVNKLERQIKDMTNKQKQLGTAAPVVDGATPALSPDLVRYVKEQYAQGAPYEQIKSSLLAEGWKPDEVSRALVVNAPAQGSQAKGVSSDEVSTPKPNAFFAWLAEDWLMKLGALLLLIGFGWLTTYAFLNNWIGEQGRIMLGIAGGVLFIALGWWRIRTRIHQGGVFLVVGSTTILLTLFAARTLYDFFTPITALGVMFLSTVFVAAAAAVYKSRALALASLVLAGIAPFLVGDRGTDTFLLFAYLMVVVLGAVWVVAVSGMKDITFAALILVSFYSLPHLFSATDRDLVLLFAYGFAAIFFVTNTVSLMKLKDNSYSADLLTAAGNGVFLLAWIMYAVSPEWQSLSVAVWMLIFVVGAFVLYQVTGRREPFYVYAGVGVVLLGAATAFELEGSALVIALAIESAVLPLIALALLQDVRIARRLAALFIVPGVLSLQSIVSSAWRQGVIHDDFFVLAVLAVALLALGSYFANRASDTSEDRSANALLLVAGSAYAYILLWLSLHAGLTEDDLATMIALVIYTVIGITVYFMGRTQDRRGLLIYGGVLLGIVVARLLVVDVWKMELTGRIITFFLIGALLIGTAFLGKRSAPRILEEKIK